MKLDTFITLIKDLREQAITDDTDPANILLPIYTSPYDQLTAQDSVRVLKFPTVSLVWGDGSTYTAYDNNGDPYQAPSCGWYWSIGGRWA